MNCIMILDSSASSFVVPEHVYGSGTAILQLRSGSAHCDQELTVEVARRRTRRMQRWRRRRALIKSVNPLARGEKSI